MGDERIEVAFRTLNHRFIALDKVEDVDPALCVVGHGFGEPMSTGLNKLAFMQARAFFAPAVAGSERFDAVDEVLPHPVSRAIPLDVCQAVLKVNGTWFAVQAEATPVPHLEREDVRRGA